MSKFLLVTGYWLLVTGYWLLVTGYWLLVTGYWLLVDVSTFFRVFGVQITLYLQRLNEIHQ